MIIGICGICASGKSTLSQELAQKYNFKYIEVDKYNIKLLKHFSKVLEVFLGFESSKLDNHTFDCLANFKQLNRIERKTYEILRKLNTLYRLPYKINKNIDKEENLIIDYVELDKFPFFDKCDIKILMKTSNESVIFSLKQRNSLNDENIAMLEKSGIVNLSKEYDESKFDFVLDINSPTYEEDKDSVLGLIDIVLSGNKEVANHTNCAEMVR